MEYKDYLAKPDETDWQTKKRLYAMHDRIMQLTEWKSLFHITEQEDIELRNLQALFADQWADYKELS